MDEKPAIRWLVCILLLAFVLRCGAAIWWQQRRPHDEPFAMGDSVSYWHLAHEISAGQPYAYPDERARVFRTPLYPLVLAPLFWISDGEPNPLMARLLGCLFGTWAVWEVMQIGFRFAGKRAAIASGIFAALYPGAIAMSILVLAEALFCPLMLASLRFLAWRTDDQEKESTIGGYLRAGIFSGLATLARPSWLLCLPLIWTAVLIDRKVTFKLKRDVILGSLLGLAVVMAPWWWRCYRLTGHFVLTSLQVGASLYDGLHEGATGASNMEFTKSFEQEFIRSRPSDDGEDFEYALDRAYRHEAVRWSQENPERVAELVGIKLRRMWKPWPSAEMFGSLKMRFVVSVGFSAVFVFGIMGLIRSWNRGWRVWLFASPVIYFTLLHVVFVSSIRYRQPAMLLWCVPAGFGLILLAEHFRSD